MKPLVYATAVLGILLLGQTSLLLNAEILIIHAYQKIGSPVTRYLASCRYEPTCSDYALGVLRSDGFWEGNLRIGSRLVRCSPLGLLLPAGDQAKAAHAD